MTLLMPNFNQLVKIEITNWYFLLAHVVVACDKSSSAKNLSTLSYKYNFE